MLARFFNTYGMNLFQGGTLGFVLNKFKNKALSDSKSEAQAELAVSIFCYAVSAISTNNGDNAALMMTLDYMLPEIYGKSATTDILKRAISIGLICLKDSYLSKSPDLIALAVTAAMGACGVVLNQALEDALPRHDARFNF